MTGLMFETFHEVILRHRDTSTGRAVEYLNYIDSCLEHAAKFVFTDDATMGDATLAFGRDLLDAGLLSLPFAACYFQYRDKSAAFCVQPSTGNIHILTLYKGDNGRIYGPIPVMLSVAEKAARSPYALPTKPHEDDWASRVGGIVDGVACFVAFLGTKGTKLETVAPKAGINAKRERKGQRPIPEYTVVKIDPEIIKTYTAKGGTHASPRPHPRRGHVATIYRGTDKERKIIKPPCFVNARDDLPRPPPQYFVKKKAS